MFRVKICGVTRMEDVRFIAKAGADAIGFQMSLGPRKLSPEYARRLVKNVPPLVTPIGVFVDEPINKVVRLVKYCGFHAAQLHGSERADYCDKLDFPVIKAIRMKTKKSYIPFRGYRVSAFLLDSYNEKTPGGTGQSFQARWSAEAIKCLPKPVILAGGLTPDNVQQAIRDSHAFGVDVSSGVEIYPGRKDPRKVSAFIRRAKSVFAG